jgi:hypothetical protein
MNKPLIPRADHNQSLGYPPSDLIYVFRPDQPSSMSHPTTLGCIDSWDLLREDLYRLGSFAPQRSLQEENRGADREVLLRLPGSLTFKNRASYI